MSAHDTDSSLNAPKTPSQEFSAYCDSELERRVNSGKGFDEHQFKKAMELVMTKLEKLEQEQ